MSQTVKITIGAAGTDTGPFNLFSDADTYTTAFATGIAKSALLAGYTSSVVPDAATIVRVKSNNANCTNYVDMTITSEVAYVEYTLVGTGYLNAGLACAAWEMELPITLYAKASEGGNSASTVQRFYTNMSGTSFTGNDGYYSWATISEPTVKYSGTITASGYTADRNVCP